MDVVNITGAQAPRGPDGRGGVDRHGQVSRGERASKASKAGDSFASSGDAAKVRELVDQLSSTPEVRAELVEKFKALMDLGELDTPEAAARAASAMLGLDEGP